MTTSNSADENSIVSHRGRVLESGDRVLAVVLDLAVLGVDGPVLPVSGLVVPGLVVLGAGPVRGVGGATLIPMLGNATLEGVGIILRACLTACLTTAALSSGLGSPVLGAGMTTLGTPGPLVLSQMQKRLLTTVVNVVRAKLKIKLTEMFLPVRW